MDDRRVVAHPHADARTGRRRQRRRSCPRLARARRPRPPQQCTVGCGHSANGKRTPALRLGGRWMEELGFTIGSTLRVQVRDGELVVSVARETGSD
ncbi:SymE family type I addiction module toxin [Xanthomonas sp. LMG 8989]|uniref:SymE family type I addiction module toxin n=1 Tax=unclassified Xanthomonas TaxID=2643310 RepID=UPI0031B712B5